MKKPKPLNPPVTVESRTDYSCVAKWSVPGFSRLKLKSLYSQYFDVGGFDFRFLIFPKGDAYNLPGYFSFYLQINDSRRGFDCYASYKMSVVNVSNAKKSVCRESMYRFSKYRKSIGWADFTPYKSLLGPSSGFLEDGSLTLSVDITVLHEALSFEGTGGSSGNGTKRNSLILNGKITWKLGNFGLFTRLIKTLKITSSSFRVSEAGLRICLYQTVVKGVEYLSLFLEIVDSDKCLFGDKSCWAFFRISVLNQKSEGVNHINRDHYGRFGGGSDTSLGWTQYMKMSDFIEKGYLVDGGGVVVVSFTAIEETAVFLKVAGLFDGKPGHCGFGGTRKNDDMYLGKFMWRIKNFVSLKDTLKKKKMTGLCVKSKKFRVGNQDFRLLIYPRGQSQKPFYLSLFLEVLDPENTSSASSPFVSYRLTVLNQKVEDKSMRKLSHGRCSKATKVWGWSDFMTLTSLFDQDSGYLDQGTAIFTAEVNVLKETFIKQDLKLKEPVNEASHAGIDGTRLSVTWKVENFLSLKTSSQNIFSDYFQVGGCQLRIGVYESEEDDRLFACLETDPSVLSDLDKNFWVSYRIAAVNLKDHTRSLSTTSSLCTRTSANVDLQFKNVLNMLEAGFIVNNTAVFVCEILDCCPWFDFSQTELLSLNNVKDAASIDSDEPFDPATGVTFAANLADIFTDLVRTAEFDISYEDGILQLMFKLKKLLMDTGAAADFLAGLRIFIDDAATLKCVMCKTKFSGNNSVKQVYSGDDDTLTNIILVWQQAINAVLLDIMVECCQPPNASTNDNYNLSSNSCLHPDTTVSQLEIQEEIGVVVSVEPSKVRKYASPETSASTPRHYRGIQGFKSNWPQPSEELLRLIVNTLKDLHGHASLVHTEVRQGPETAEKVFLLLEKAPKILQPDLASLLPKLVNHSEHSLVASALLGELLKQDAKPALRSHVLDVISHLNLDNQEWEQTLFQASQVVDDTNDEALGDMIDLLFTVASQCNCIPQAVRVVRIRLGSLGANISPFVLDLVSETVDGHHEIGEVMLGEINSVFELDEKHFTNPIGCSLNGGNELTIDSLHLVDKGPLCSRLHFSDICVLIYLLAIPSLACKASQAFERAVAGRYIENHTVATVLGKHAYRLDKSYQHRCIEGKRNAKTLGLEEVFTALLALADVLSLSTNPHVHYFVKRYYVMLFRLFPDDSHQTRMLRGLVDHATRPEDKCSEISLDIFVFLICEEHRFAKPILSKMKEAAERANADCSTISSNLCNIEKELVNTRKEKQTEISNIIEEKTVLLERLNGCENTILLYKSQMELEMDHYACKKKELCGKIQALEHQLEHVLSKRNDDVEKLHREKKDYQDRLLHKEMQFSQLESEHSLALKKVTKENNALAAKLRKSGDERKRFCAELKRRTSEAVAQEEAKQKLLNEIRQLKQEVEQTRLEKQDKEQEIAFYKAHTNQLEQKLNTCQKEILSLREGLKEEMMMHAPLYGHGLEYLSARELETLRSIHVQGLQAVDNCQQQQQQQQQSSRSGKL